MKYEKIREETRLCTFLHVTVDVIWILIVLAIFAAFVNFTNQFFEKQEQTRKFVVLLPLKGKKEKKLNKTSNI